MVTLNVKLAALIIDNPPGLFASTKAEIALENSIGRLSVENYEGDPLSVHRFIVRDAADVGVGAPYNLGAEEAGSVLAIACSLTNPRVLFSSSQPTQLGSSVEAAAVPTKVEVVDTPTGKAVNITETLTFSESLSTRVGIHLTLNERQILDVARSLLKFRIFDPVGRPLQERNILEAIRSYREAMKSARSAACVAFLYAALEKAVNMSAEREGPDFDNEAALLAGMAPQEIKDIREFYNRNKHALRDGTDLATLEAGEARLPQLVKSLKKAADSVILKRI